MRHNSVPGAPSMQDFKGRKIGISEQPSLFLFFFFLKAKDRLHTGCTQCGLTIHTLDLFSQPFFRQQ